MISPWEILLVAVVLGALFLIQTRTRSGSLLLYLAVAGLLVVLILAIRMIRSLIGAVLALVFLGAILLWFRLSASR